MNLHCHRHPATASTGSSTLFPPRPLARRGAPAAAQTTVSLNLDYAEGKYGEPDKSSSWTMPLIVKHRPGRSDSNSTFPYIRATGTTQPQAATASRRPGRPRRAGATSPTTVAYDIYHDTAGGTIIDLTAKAKFATADKARISSPPAERLLAVDRRPAPLRRDDGIRHLGWTKRATRTASLPQPAFLDPGTQPGFPTSSPWAPFMTTARRSRPGDPVSEATLFVERKFDSQYKLQGYLVRGFPMPARISAPASRSAPAFSGLLPGSGGTR